MNHCNYQDAPRQSTHRVLFEANDADEHALNLTNWQQEYDQISRGKFYGNILELPLDDIQLFKEHTSQALNQTCNVWPDSLWFGISSHNNADVRIDGLPVERESIMCRPGNHEFELTTPASYDIFGIVVSISALKDVAEIHGLNLNWQELNYHCRLDVPQKTLSELRFVLNRTLASEHSATTKRLQHDVVMMALLDVLQKETPNQIITQSHQHRKSVVDNVRAYLSTHQNTPVTITELCDISNVSRRTLQYSFESIMGISPLQFLRMNRLNGVRRALYRCKTSGDFDRSIADIASHWGFWHLSQFAKDYKQLFGELPSETYHRVD